MNKTIITVLILFASCSAIAGEGHKDRSHKPRSEKQATTTQLTSVNQTAQAGASSRAGAIAGANAAGGSGGSSMASATGGAGGLATSSATTGSQSQVFSPVLNWAGIGSGASGLTGKINPDVSPPSMPSVSPCTVGLSAGISVAGFGLGGGGYTDDLLCGWERQHALETAVGNREGADDIRRGMTMIRCENTPEPQRKYFKACADLQREHGEQKINPAFSSAG